MSQDNMPELPNADYSRRISGVATPEHDGDLKVAPLYTAEQMHAYARQYAEMRVAAEREAIARLVVETMWWKREKWQSTICHITRQAIAAAIRARSGAQDEGRTG